jgi:hypothetical protein
MLPDPHPQLSVAAPPSIYLLPSQSKAGCQPATMARKKQLKISLIWMPTHTGCYRTHQSSANAGNPGMHTTHSSDAAHQTGAAAAACWEQLHEVAQHATCTRVTRALKRHPEQQAMCCIMTTSNGQQVCKQKHSHGCLLPTARLCCRLTAKAKAKAARAS